MIDKIVLNISRLVVCACCVLVMSAGQNAAPSLDLLRHAMDPNPNLHSYTASAHLDAVLNTLVPVHQSLTGTVYALGDKRKIVFDHAPPGLNNLKDLTQSTPTFEQISSDFTIAPQTDDGKTSTFVLTPKKEGRVKTLELKVDDKSMLVTSSLWTYTDGSTLRDQPTYEAVQGFSLPERVAMSARFPAYSIDGTLQFSGYQPNAHVDPQVFADSP